MMDRLARETDEGKKIAVVLDNARFHHAQGPDQPIHPPVGPQGASRPSTCPPTPPTLGPTEHVRDAAKNNIANPRALAPQNTFAAFTAYITNRTFDYDFEHLPITPPHTDFV